MKNLRLIIIGIVLSLKATTQTDVGINPNFIFNGESNLVVNPANNNDLVVAWIKLVSFSPVSTGIAVSRSSNGGLTWSSPIVMPHFRTNDRSADPTMVYDKNGNLFLAYIDTRTLLDSAQVYVTKSTNQGLSWSTPVEVVNNFASPDFPIDRPWIAVDNSSGPYSGNLYLVTKSYKSTQIPHHVWAMKSSDAGLTWTTPKLVDDSIPSDLMTITMGVPAVAADGKLYIVYMSYSPGLSFFPRYVFVKSTDGGGTYTYHQLATFPVNAGFASTDSLYQFSFNLSANPTNASNLILVTTDNRNGDPDILSYETQDGLLFNSPLRVNDDFIGNGVGQDMCWAGYNKFGTYGAFWRDRRNSGAGQSAAFNVFGAYSVNGGVSYNVNNVIQITPSPAITSFEGNDFIGVALGDSCLYSSWADFRNNTLNQLFFNKVCIPQITGIENFNQALESKIYPNPTNKFVDVEAPTQRWIKRITVRDVEGKVVVNRNELHHKSLKINVERFDSGLYQIEIFYEDGKMEVGKIIVIPD